VGAVYLRTGGNGFILLDDDRYLTGNAVVLEGLTARGVGWALTSFHASNWHPLAWISHMADVSLFGIGNPGAHHLESAALHGANVLLLFFLLLRLTGARGRSLFAAALFAVHPLHVESVAWAAERKDLLCALFFLLALHAWGGYAKRGGGGRYAAALLLYSLALASKPMAVTLPFVLLLLDAWPLGRTALSPPADGTGHAPVPYGTLLLEKVPFLLLSAASCAVTMKAQEGALASYFAWLPPGQRFANAIVAYPSYLGKLLWPADLAVLYPLAPPPGIPAWKAAGAALLLAAVTALALREGRRRPFLPVGWLWFLGTLVPVIGIVRVGSQAMADRYAYLPFPGLYVAAAWGIAEACRRLPWREKALPAAACAVVLALGAASWRQAGYWKDTESLFLRTLAVTRGNFLIEANLGSWYGMGGRHDLAAARFAEAVRIEPEYEDGRFNLGTALLRLGRPAEALPHLQEALKVMQDARAANRVGEALAALGRHGEAAGSFRLALLLDPGNGEALANLERLGK
jgi:tetratricopeptide (TPR) repeat protein